MRTRRVFTVFGHTKFIEDIVGSIFLRAQGREEGAETGLRRIAGGVRRRTLKKQADSLSKKAVRRAKVTSQTLPYSSYPSR